MSIPPPYVSYRGHWLANSILVSLHQHAINLKCFYSSQKRCESNSGRHARII